MALSFLEKAFRPVFDSIEIKTFLNQQQSIELDRFVGSTPSFLISYLKRQTKRRLIVVAPSHELAQFLKLDLDTLEVPGILFQPTFSKPYDRQQMVDASVLVERSEALMQIQEHKEYVVITSAEAMFERVPAPERFAENAIPLKKGQHINPELLCESLLDQGYAHVSFVDSPGEFAQRGGILDVFPFSGKYPIRIEFFGNEIDSIREFDTDSQRSVAFLTEAKLVPKLELSGKDNGLFFLDYFDKRSIVLTLNPDLLQAQLNEQWNEAIRNFERLAAPDEHQKPDHVYLNADVWKTRLKENTVLSVHSGHSARSVFTLQAQPHPNFNGSFKLLRANIAEQSNQGNETLILCDNNAQRDRFEELLGEFDPETNRYTLMVNRLYQGFILPNEHLAVFTDHQIFNRYLRPPTNKKTNKGGLSFKELKDLNVGDFVVHVDFGIGRFEGFKAIEVKGQRQESVKLRYKDDSILFVNVSSLHKLQKFSGKDGSMPTLTKLGSGEWQKKKARTKSRLKDIARELIQLYAKRKMQKAFAFKPDSAWQMEMEAAFQFEETPDQMTAIEAVKRDMETSTPMDRLICGDVGFGKTEVAVRAAFKAVMDQKQVAVLVPTTILADQHFHTFSERMADFPIKVEVISRFKNKAEQKRIVKELAEGKIDILVGTHRLASKDVRFHDLGLLIIDEEQRFGVSMKEKLRQFRASVDTLTLSATPIPRTLNMSLMGARDLSVINTAPPNRQPVQTEIHSFDSQLIRDAIIQETSRGGQVFFVHNRILNIEEMANMLREQIPDLRIRWAHGQMSSAQLEKIIYDFYHHKYDVLLSTSIIENGIDIPNANTIIINRADLFGLSELHQLRGRVGRSNRKGYCYLITPPLEDMTLETRKRLLALVEYSDLGSGFNIAMRDLDIRGAGDVLGAEQSGFINEIGFDLYMKTLDEAVNELKSTEFKALFEDEELTLQKPETTVEFDLDALLEREYVEDNVERLNLYRRLAECANESDIERWVEEVEDRFGPLTESGRNLVTAARIKRHASHAYLAKVTIRAHRMWLQCPKAKTKLGQQFYQSNTFQRVMKKVQALGESRFKLVQKDDAVRFIISEINNLDEAVDFLKNLHEEQLEPA